MRVLTVHQPWAWAIIHGGKDVENRTWKPKLGPMGERIAIHAGRKYDSDALKARHWSVAGLKYPFPLTWSLGAIIGTVLVESWSQGGPLFSEWCDPGEGLYHWHLVDPIPLTVPIPCRGHQGLWGFDLSAFEEGRSDA